MVGAGETIDRDRVTLQQEKVEPTAGRFETAIGWQIHAEKTSSTSKLAGETESTIKDAPLDGALLEEAVAIPERFHFGEIFQEDCHTLESATEIAVPEHTVYYAMPGRAPITTKRSSTHS